VPFFFMALTRSEGRVSHEGPILCHAHCNRIRDIHLSTEFVHNHVDRARSRTQTRNAAKGFALDDRSFASRLFAQH